MTVQPPHPRKWTVLAYMSGDSDLEDTEVYSLLQMERVGSNDDVDVVVQLDRREIPEEHREHRLGVDGDWSTARRYHVTRGADHPGEVLYHLDAQPPYADIRFSATQLSSELVQDLGEVDSAAGKTLADFLSWGMENYPAEHYLVLLMDHGYGILGAIQDESSQELAPLPELRAALEDAERRTGRRIDIVGFDACLMGLAEAAYEFKDVTSVVVGSQDYENVPGWPLAAVLARLQQESRSAPMPVEEVAGMIVEEAARTPQATPTLSAVRTDRMEQVREAVEGLAGELLEPDVSPYYLRRAVHSARSFGDPLNPPLGDSVDLVDVAGRIASHPQLTNPGLQRAARAVEQAAGAAVLAECHTPEQDGAHGLSIYMPAFVRRYDVLRNRNPLSSIPEPGERFSYRKLRFAENARWEKLLREKFVPVS
ncbi:MAG: hypothetical protein HY319_16730 [Armatimonadetes bacterium]|nr:hypothetical protein [Armatimonadota bacterium]